MKKTIATIALLACTSLPLLSQSVTETTETTTTTTTPPAITERTITTTYGTGTIHEYTPGKTIVVKETSGPVSYTYSSGVVYVNNAGEALTEEQVKTRIKIGAPVNVYYTTEGDTRTVTRVEVMEVTP